MLCTINTDASFHPKYKVGAFAFWAVSNDFKIQKAGFLRKFCKNPTDSEAKCIVNAFKVVLSGNINITKIIVNTDSLNSIAIFENNKKHIKKYNLVFGEKHRRILDEIKRKYRKHIEIEFRHVKAHSDVSDARSYVNEWCDKEAKFYLWKRINELKNMNKL